MWNLSNAHLFKRGAISRKSLVKVQNKIKNYSKGTYDCENADKRGCLPWENPDNDNIDSTECKPKSFIEKLKALTLFEKKRFSQCIDECDHPAECTDRCLKFANEWKEHMKNTKEYPMIHATKKTSFPGCPMSNWQEISKLKQKNSSQKE